MSDEPESNLGRLTRAFESIANSLERLATLSENRFQKDFPEKRAPVDVTLTRTQTEEDRIREEQGFSEEPIEEWMGHREKGFLENLAPKSPR